MHDVQHDDDGLLAADVETALKRLRIATSDEGTSRLRTAVADLRRTSRLRAVATIVSAEARHEADRSPSRKVH